MPAVNIPQGMKNISMVRSRELPAIPKHIPTAFLFFKAPPKSL
jgi:hypothetical protein